MGLLAYARKFDSSIAAKLEGWHKAFQGKAEWEWVQRNIDRECVRSDIKKDLWDDFLIDVAELGVPSDPCQPIKDALNTRRSYFFLPGREIDGTGNLFHYMRLDRFALFYLREFPVASAQEWADRIDRGLISGTALAMKVFGKPGAPVWVTDDGLSTTTSADDIRDQLSLPAPQGNNLVEVAYPATILTEQNESLRAPTVLDGLWVNTDNWAFVKNADPGGPGWGYTLDRRMRSAGARGRPEAVHAPISTASGESISLRAIGPTRTDPPEVDYRHAKTTPGL